MLGGEKLEEFNKLLDKYKLDIEEDINKRVDFISNYINEARADGVVIGISGGIDSAVTAALLIHALGREKVLGVWMPAYSNSIHKQDAFLLAKKIDLNLVEVDLGKTFDTISLELEKVQCLSDLSKGNIKARLRMTTLYAIAGERNYLVTDTCNYSEIYIGYMTKGGDGLADFNPIGSLTKHQIRILANYFKIPDTIIEKPPSADLWVNQTDEKEMGFSYVELDRYLLTGKGNQDIINKIDTLHRKSKHKRVPMPSI